MGTFITSNIFSENGITGTTISATNISSTSISGDTFYGDGSNITNISSNCADLSIIYTYFLF